MPVTGIGGLFVRAKDADARSTWYEAYFGITMTEAGPGQQSAGPTVFMPFAHDTDYFAADKQRMMNLRVDDLDEILGGLCEGKIEVTTKAEWDTPETGRFAPIYDPEGNAVELWEAPVEA
jgi:predicted enzyme related to lactoylglutathione lyase